MPDIWISIKELAELMDSYLKKAQREADNFTTRYVPGRGKGGKVMQVALESLPADLQEKYFKEKNTPDRPRSTRPMSRGHMSPVSSGRPLEPGQKVLTPRGVRVVSDEGKLVPVPAGTKAVIKKAPAPAPVAETRPSNTPLTPSQDKKALAMADLVRYMRDSKARAKKAGQKKTRAAENAINLYNNGFILQDIFTLLGSVTLKTVYRWDKALKKADGDYTVLAPRHGHSRGTSSLTDVEREAFLRTLLRPQRHKIGSAIRITRAILSERGISSSASDATFRRFAEAYRKDNHHIWVMARQGEKALDDKVLPYIERDRTLLNVGEVLVADGHPLNFFVVNPWTGKPCRATMVLFFDWASAYPCGFEIMLTEDVQCIQAAFRRAVLTLGKLPGHALIDNGKAFRAKVFTSQTDLEQAGIYGMYARLGVEVRFARPYNAKDKPVERFFSTFSEWVERLIPSYCGASIEDKPAYMMRNEKYHKAMHQEFTPTIAQAVQLVQAGLDFYSRQPHSGLGGRTPLEVFEAGRGPGVNEAELRHMMLSRDVRTIHRNGIKMFGGHYWNDSLVGLKGRVLVKYDFEDLTRVLVYGTDGGFLGEAQRTHVFDPLLRGDDRAALKQRMKERNQIKRNVISLTKAVQGGQRAPEIDWQPIIDAVPETSEIIEAAEDSLRVEASMDTGVPVIEHEASDEPFFDEAYQRFEYLMKKDSLTGDEKEWMAWYEGTSEYRTIFVELKQASG